MKAVISIPADVRCPLTVQQAGSSWQVRELTGPCICQGADWTMHMSGSWLDHAHVRELPGTYTCALECNMPHPLTATRFCTGIFAETRLWSPNENSRYKQWQQAKCSRQSVHCTELQSGCHASEVWCGWQVTKCCRETREQLKAKSCYA